MGQKQSKAQRIVELEEHLAQAKNDNAKWEACFDESQRDLRSATFNLNRYRDEEKRQKEIADAKKREEERQAERDRLNDLSNGLVDLSKIRHDFGFDYDHDTVGGTVTITLHANAREAKILNAYGTRDRRDPEQVTCVGTSLREAVDRIMLEH